MKCQGKSAVAGVILCLFSVACGDLIKVRHPGKKLNTPEPEQKTSALYGTCTNFQGHWSVHCATQGSFPTEFYLIQQYCDLFILHNLHRSFEGSHLAWSDARDTVTLQADQESLVLQNRDGVRQGTWTRGEQSCPMSWAP